MNKNSWAGLHQHYSAQNWIGKPSLFAQTAISYFPQHAQILELGAGQGQDARYFADNGFHVTATDLEQSAIEKAQAKMTPAQRKLIAMKIVDLRHELPFSDAIFGVVYAHLSLHYFDREHTERLFGEIGRVLKPGGVLAFFVNSTSDPEHGSGKQLEPDFFQIDGVTKRYFSIESTRDLIRREFDVILLDNQGETYKDAAEGVHSLVRFIGTKRATSHVKT